ncbi:glycosyltransferase family protein [Tessaracoccus sp. Y1736]
MNQVKGAAFVAIVPRRWSVYTKIRAQARAFTSLKDNGELRDLLVLESQSEGLVDTYLFGDSQVRLRYGGRANALANLLWRYPSLYWMIYRELSRKDIDVLYLRKPPILDLFTILWLLVLRWRGIRVLFEVPTYPYDSEMRSRALALMDRVSRVFLRFAVYAIVTSSGESIIFGVRCIPMSNGVDFAEIPMTSRRTGPSKIVITCVSSLESWHQVERLLLAFSDYLCNGGDRISAVHIVGDGPELEHLRRLSSGSDLVKALVVFHGALYGEELTDVFANTTLAVGNLEESSTRGLSQVQPLKHREYAARGIPFFYGLRDTDFTDAVYALQVPEGPLDLGEIVQWADELDIASESIRGSVEHLAWEAQLRFVLNA